MQHSLRGALARTLHCIPIRSASTSAPVWPDTCTTAAMPALLPGRKPGLQKPRLFKEILKGFK